MKFYHLLPGISLTVSPREPHWSQSLTGEDFGQIAQMSERYGFNHLHFSDHLVMHNDFVEHLGPRWMHTLSAMAYVAGTTSTIKICGLIVLPYHHPVELAKSISTIDVLSGGRTIVIAAAGYMDWEYDIVGVPYDDRGRVMDEYLAALIELWTSDAPEFHGKYVSFEDIVFDPKPLQQPHPTLWFAGFAKPALRRLARLGSGWITYNTSRAEFPGMIDYIRSRKAFLENPRPLELSLPLFEKTINPATHELLAPPRIVLEKEYILDQVGQLAEIGVTMVAADLALGTIGGGSVAERNGQPVPPARSKEDFLERLQWFGEDVLPEARRIEPRVYA